ncbi:FAD:protein FMN transferase ApbE [Psychromonas sp. Urea-02u-13]|uniref:FAD:protein FMN transferase n=1 Tax=Psychromonas sp. Urea-02u-13 TaxID=2058326 RepID=UPI000C325409|nr:FAD:protein FMN transferase [Psychromonas sp. Urea-02u-13]PKG38643.1 FAD:protein FMN transferase ApbE [Psychromonas sp. Urea-02u-13]
MRNQITKWLALIGLAFFISSCSEPVPKSKLVMVQGKTMGTYYQVTMVLREAQLSKPDYTLSAMQIEIDKKLELVNDQMSTYRPDSELSYFNQAKTSFTVSPATAYVVKSSLALFEQSEGAFDVTVGPLVNLWGFGPDKRPNKVPSDEIIASQQKRVGSQYLSIEGNTLFKSIPDLYVDLSSIAKGYGVDVIAEYLQNIGINDYLVDIGGELRAKGVKPADKQWTLAIERPVAGQNVQRLIQIGDNAIATSGDYRNYYEFDGIRYSHTIDPKTGKPIKHKLVSVTVIHASSMMADGLATVITVLGPEAGFEFAQKHNLAVFLLVKQGEGFIEHFTAAFKPYLFEEK